MKLSDVSDSLSGFDCIAFLDCDRSYCSGYRGDYRYLHLHGLEDDDSVAFAYLISCCFFDLPYLAGRSADYRFARGRSCCGRCG